jgi:hypothetical protein
MKNKVDSVNALEGLEFVDSETVFLDSIFNSAFIGMNTVGSALYELYEVITIIMEQENCEDDFESWEDYYDWAQEMAFSMVNSLANKGIDNEFIPQLVVLKDKD